jgi:hypothetical protein
MAPADATDATLANPVKGEDDSVEEDVGVYDIKCSDSDEE